MAIPLFFADVSPVSTRLVCILFSGLVLPVVYAMGRRAGGNVAGWLAVLFLGFSAFENLFASMARFYLPFQFFFVAAVYWAGEYFIRNRFGSGKWLLLSTIGAISSHEFAVELLLVFLLAGLIGRHYQIFRQGTFWLWGLALAILGYFLLAYQPEAAFVNYMAIPLVMSGLQDKAVFYEWFRQLTPFGVTLLILGVYPLLCGQKRIAAFYCLAFLYGLLFVMVVAPGDNPRYISNLYPLGVVVSVFSLVWWGRKVIAVLVQRRVPLLASRPVVLGIVLSLAIGHLAILENVDVSKAFGGYFKYIDQAPAHAFILQRCLPGDLVITTEPSLTELYLGTPADFYLREKYDNNTRAYSMFSKLEKSRQILRMLDSKNELLQVLNERPNRLWLYTNWKITSTISIETDRLVREHFIPMYSRDETYVLLKK